MKSDLKRWNALPLSLLGRINSIKMNVLPRFSFLFQCLQQFLSKSFFKDLNKAFSSFIWAGKTPRVKYSILQRSKKDCGLALPSLLSFYWAANIQKIHTWNNYPATDWCQMEAHSCGSISLSALFGAPLNSYPANYTSNLIVLSTVKIWKQFRCYFKTDSLSSLMPICNNHIFFPPSLNSEFSLWKEKGQVHFK